MRKHEKLADDLTKAAAMLGRKGGLVRVPKGAAMLTAKERHERAKKAAAARWHKTRKAK